MSDEIAPSAHEPEESPAELEAQAVSQTRFVFTPPIDIYETDEGLILQADLPGVSLDTLELQVQDNKLTLFGRVQPHVPESAQPVHQEFEVGDFLRSFILSGEIDHERISATLNHGVLKVILPRMPRTEPRRIQVNSD
jgi:HSP20 family molecular chaperone IbpA